MPFLLESGYAGPLLWCFCVGVFVMVALLWCFFEVVVRLCFVAVWHHFSTPRLSCWQLWVSAWAPWRPMAWQFSGGCACGVVVFLVWLCFCGGVVVFFVVVLWLCLCGPVGGVFLWSCGGAFVQKFLLAPAYAHCKTWARLEGCPRQPWVLCMVVGLSLHLDVVLTSFQTSFQTAFALLSWHG